MMGIWERVILTIWTFFKAETNLEPLPINENQK